jgi:hypothetical protein
MEVRIDAGACVIILAALWISGNQRLSAVEIFEAFAFLCGEEICSADHFRFLVSAGGGSNFSKRSRAFSILSMRFSRS